MISTKFAALALVTLCAAGPAMAQTAQTTATTTASAPASAGANVGDPHMPRRNGLGKAFFRQGGIDERGKYVNSHGPNVQAVHQ